MTAVGRVAGWRDREPELAPVSVNASELARADLVVAPLGAGLAPVGALFITSAGRTVRLVVDDVEAADRCIARLEAARALLAAKSDPGVVAIPAGGDVRSGGPSAHHQGARPHAAGEASGSFRAGSLT